MGERAVEPGAGSVIHHGVDLIESCPGADVYAPPVFRQQFLEATKWSNQGREHGESWATPRVTTRTNMAQTNNIQECGTVA